MSAYYQVYSEYTLSNDKPQLVSVTLHSTSEYYPFLVGSDFSNLAHSRYFHTQKEANHYIDYLFSRYPNSAASRRPVLDALQLTFF
jgi:hypothetical protein